MTKVVGVGDQRVGRAIPGRQEPQEPRDDLDPLTALIEQIDPVGAFLAALLPNPHSRRWGTSFTGAASRLSTDATVILAYVGWHEEAARADLEDLRGEDCTVLLGRLVNTGFLDVVRAHDGHRANRYRLTTDALQALGVASPEELRAKLGSFVDDAARTDADRR